MNPMANAIFGDDPDYYDEEEDEDEYSQYYDYDDGGGGAVEKNFPTLTQGGTLTAALRRLLCPICVARRFAFNSLTVIDPFYSIPKCYNAL